MKAAFKLQLDERNYDVTDEIPADMPEMDVKRITIRQQMLNHLRKATTSGMLSGKNGERISVCNGEDTALPKNTDLLSLMRTAESTNKRQQFDSIDDGDGIKMAIF